MKILMIIDTLRSGGKERRLIELIKGLKLRKIDCEIIILSNRIEYQEILDVDIKLHILQRVSKKDLTIISKIYRICLNFKPSIIQAWESMPAIYAAPIAKYLGIKFINSMISNAPESINIFSKRWVRAKLTFILSDAIIANSKAGLKSYNAPPHKSTYIYNGFDITRLKTIKDKDYIKNKFNINSDYIIGMVASFTDNKDYKTFLLAANQILNRYNHVCFICVGDGKHINKMKLIVDQNHSQKILFTGQQSEVESIVNVFDIGVLSTYTEGISNSIMEYMILKKPVVATDGGGTAELVLNNKTGFLIPRHSVSDMVEKLEYLIKNEKQAEIMGHAGYKRIVEKFNLENMTNQYITLYKKLMPKEGV